MALRFRLAESGDVEAIVDLVDSAYRADASRAGWTTEADLLDGQRTDTEAVSAIVDACGSAMLVAEAGGQLAGCCQLERRPDGEVYFGLFAVRPGWQGGRGQEILAAERAGHGRERRARAAGREAPTPQYGVMLAPAR